MDAGGNQRGNPAFAGTVGFAAGAVDGQPLSAFRWGKAQGGFGQRVDYAAASAGSGRAFCGAGRGGAAGIFAAVVGLAERK